MASVLSLEGKSSVSDKTVYDLSDLIPDAITANLWDYFNEFMLTKLKMAQILSPVDFSEREGENEWLTSQYNAVEGLIGQFGREIKPALLKRFAEIVQYARSFGLYYPYYKEEIQQLTKDSATSGYKAAIAAMFEHIPVDHPVANGKGYLTLYQRLQSFIDDLQQRYDSLYPQAHEQLDQGYANVLTDIEKRFNDPLEAAAERLLSNVVISSDPVSLNLSSVQVVAAEEANSLEDKKQHYYIRKYEESLRPLKMIEDSKKNLFLFTLGLKRCVNRLANLAEAVKAVDSFWEDSQSNLKALEAFIVNHKIDETAQDYLMNYIEAARWDFEFLEDYAKHLASSTSIGTSTSGHKNNLKLTFLLKDSVVI